VFTCSCSASNKKKKRIDNNALHYSHSSHLLPSLYHVSHFSVCFLCVSLSVYVSLYVSVCLFLSVSLCVSLSFFPLDYYQTSFCRWPEDSLIVMIVSTLHTTLSFAVLQRTSSFITTHYFATPHVGQLRSMKRHTE
jgi:hypothetical protein